MQVLVSLCFINPKAFYLEVKMIALLQPSLLEEEKKGFQLSRTVPHNRSSFFFVPLSS